jgi:hypothetical protein
MCRITEYRYTCTHHIVHVWSACRGQVKATKPSKTPACQKTPRLCIRLATKCGSCLRSEAERKLRRTLTWTTDHQPTEIIESILQERLNEIATQIPTTNWCPLPSPVYGRKPSQKRLLTPRKHSLLREQVKPEDACGPEAWEDNVVLPVYEAVANGWNFEWTSETKSLAEELAEDLEAAKYASGEEEDEVDENNDLWEADEEAEGDDGAEIDDEVEIDDEADGDDKEEEKSTNSSPSEPLDPIGADLGGEQRALIQYRFRKTTPGRKTERRIWEIVVLTA